MAVELDMTTETLSDLEQLQSILKIIPIEKNSPKITGNDIFVFNLPLFNNTSLTFHPYTLSALKRRNIPAPAFWQIPRFIFSYNTMRSDAESYLKVFPFAKTAWQNYFHKNQITVSVSVPAAITIIMHYKKNSLP